MDAPIQSMTIDGVRVDLQRHEALRGEERCALSPQEVAILRAFASRGHDATLTRLELYREAWGYSREPQGRALDYAMRRLREKLGATNSTGSTLGTVRGVGYRLLWSAAQPAPPAAPRSAAAAAPAPALPPAPALVGRAAAVADGLDRIRQPGALVTLLGPGGIGKSSLAAAICHGVTGHTRVWVDLEAAAVGAAEDAIARALFPPGDSEDPFSERVGHLLAVREQPITLFLDGAERHLDELPGVLAGLDFPRLHVLITSRERLLLRRESVLQVPPLPRPDAERLLRDIARQRGGDRPEGEDMQLLLDQLDGLPLAVELAGARLRTRSAADLARAIAAGRPLRTRERDRADRHASMGAVVQSSLERLTPEQQGALHELTVFQGYFGIEAAGRALGMDVYDAEEIIEALVDSSMLHFEEQEGALAYRILRPTHTVLTRLHGTPQAARQRLIAHYDALGHADPFRALGRDGGALLRTLRPHALDLAALAEGAPLDAPGFGLLTLVAFDNLGMASDARRVSQRILEHIQPEDDFRILVQAMACRFLHRIPELAALCEQLDDPAGAEGRLVRMLCIQRQAVDKAQFEDACRALIADARAAADHYVLGRTSRALGFVLIERNDLDETEDLFQDYLSAARIDDNIDNTVSAWSSLARVAFARGDAEESIRRLRSARAAGGPNHRYSGVLVGNQGLVHLAVGDIEAAEEVTLTGLELARRHGNIIQTILSMGVLTEIYLELEDFDRGERYARQAVELALAHLTQASFADRIWSHLAVLECMRGNFHAARAVQDRWTDHFGPDVSRTSQALLAPVQAWIEAGLGHPEAARALLEEAPPATVVWQPGREWLASQAALQLGDLDLATACLDRLEAIVDERGAGAQNLRRAKRTRARIAALRAAAD